MCGSARLDDLAVELQHQAQHAVRRRMLRAEVQRVVLDLGHVSATSPSRQPP
jgi:hypothetical protein